ncbi:MAG: hypothetical protein KatS3mg076_1471 [Candidatus Binatia bacterium]|nr:MAG: hypothetical protein KatS3mg076_1471 [Candidatus Binatia bacterium]
MQDRPAVTEVLELVREFLLEEVVPALEGPRKFHARVAANLLAVVGREWEREESSLRAEWTRLRELLGKTGELPGSRQALRDEVASWTAELCERIRRGEADSGPWGRAVREHVRETVREKLAIAHPGYDRPPS